MVSESRFSHFNPHEPPAGDGARQTRNEDAESWGDDPVERLGKQFSELKAYAWQRCAARIERLSLEVRRAVVLAVIGVAALIAAVAAVIVAVVLLLSGAAGGIAELLAGRLWLANLIVGGSTLGLMAGAFAASYLLWARASRQKAKEKYERRSQEQRRRFGHSAADRASGGASHG